MSRRARRLVGAGSFLVILALQSFAAQRLSSPAFDSFRIDDYLSHSKRPLLAFNSRDRFLLEPSFGMLQWALSEPPTGPFSRETWNAVSPVVDSWADLSVGWLRSLVLGVFNSTIWLFLAVISAASVRRLVRFALSDGPAKWEALRGYPLLVVGSVLAILLARSMSVAPARVLVVYPVLALYFFLLMLVGLVELRLLRPDWRARHRPFRPGILVWPSAVLTALFFSYLAFAVVLPDYGAAGDSLSRGVWLFAPHYADPMGRAVLQSAEASRLPLVLLAGGFRRLYVSFPSPWRWQGDIEVSRLFWYSDPQHRPMLAAQLAILNTALWAFLGAVLFGGALLLRRLVRTRRPASASEETTESGVAQARKTNGASRAGTLVVYAGLVWFLYAFFWTSRQEWHGRLDAWLDQHNGRLVVYQPDVPGLQPDFLQFEDQLLNNLCGIETRRYREGSDDKYYRAYSAVSWKAVDRRVGRVRFQGCLDQVWRLARAKFPDPRTSPVR